MCCILLDLVRKAGMWFVWVDNEAFFCAHVCISCRYHWMFAFAMVISLCVDVMVMSSALAVKFAGARGVGVPDVYMLKGVGDSTPPCVTPLLNWYCVDVLFLNVVYALRPLMQFAMYLISVSSCALPGIQYKRVSHIWTIFRINRIIYFRILIYSTYHLFWLFCVLICYYVYDYVHYMCCILCVCINVIT